MHVLETSLAKQTGDLACDDVDGGARHETANSGSRDELDQPPEAKETDAEHDETADECHRCRNLVSGPLIGVTLVDCCDNPGHREGHDGDGADRDILGCSKQLRERRLTNGPRTFIRRTYAVDEDTDESRVKTVLGGQRRNLEREKPRQLTFTTQVQDERT